MEPSETAGNLQLNLVAPSTCSSPKYPKYEVTGESSSVSPLSKDTAKDASKNTGGTASTNQEEPLAAHSFPERPESPMVVGTAAQPVLADEPESASANEEGVVTQSGTNASTEAATKGSTPADESTSAKTGEDVTSSARLNVDDSSGAEVVGPVAREPELSTLESTTPAADEELPHPSSSENEDSQPAKPLGKESSCASGMPPSSLSLEVGKEKLALFVSHTLGNDWLANLSSSDDEEVDEEEELEDTMPPDPDFLGL